MFTYSTLKLFYDRVLFTDIPNFRQRYLREIFFSISLNLNQVNKVYMGGVNLRLSVNCLYDLVIENFGLGHREFTRGIRDIRTKHTYSVFFNHLSQGRDVWKQEDVNQNVVICF